MRQEMRQEQCQHPLARAVLELARWGFRRNIEPLEALSLVVLLGWAVSLSQRGLFASVPSLYVMSYLTAFMDRWHLPREWPWAFGLWLIVAHLTGAYVLGAWSYWANGYWDDDDRRVFWARRIRFGGLTLLAMWWMFVAGMVGWANFPGTGWKTYAALGVWTAWTAVRLVWDYGVRVLPLARVRQ